MISFDLDVDEETESRERFHSEILAYVSLIEGNISSELSKTQISNQAKCKTKSFCDVKIPKLTLKSFSGVVEEWLPFLGVVSRIY